MKITFNGEACGVWRFKDKLDPMNGQPLYHLNWHVVPTTEPAD